MGMFPEVKTMTTSLSLEDATNKFKVRVGDWAMGVVEGGQLR